jgi:hypothetical protein
MMAMLMAHEINARKYDEDSYRAIKEKFSRGTITLAELVFQVTELSASVGMPMMECDCGYHDEIARFEYEGEFVCPQCYSTIVMDPRKI